MALVAVAFLSIRLYEIDFSLSPADTRVFILAGRKHVQGDGEASTGPGCNDVLRARTHNLSPGAPGVYRGGLKKPKTTRQPYPTVDLASDY